MKAVLPAAAHSLLEPHLPADLDVAWFATPEEAKAMIVDADIAWVDIQPSNLIADAIRHAGPNLKWVSTIYAGLDAFPLDTLRNAGITLTNGAGINAAAVAEYAMMAVLVAAKRFDTVLRAQDRHEWLKEAPGKIELAGTKALVIGYGTIGRMIGDRLIAFGIEISGVTRTGREGTITAGAWRDRLDEFDWVILAAPSTQATRAMIGQKELQRMKTSAWLINIARGDMVDDDALISALTDGTIAGAVLDPTYPEPLPTGHPLWSTPNALVTMHLAGRSQTTMLPRGAALFLDNLAAFLADRPMKNVADLEAGY